MAFQPRQGEFFQTRNPQFNISKNMGFLSSLKRMDWLSGKGVTVATSKKAAIEAVQKCFKGAFGESGGTVLIEEYLEGDESSILAFVDNKCIKPLASSQDHKRLSDGDLGPNTGGMGAYSPSTVIDDHDWILIREKILQPFLLGCQKENLDFRGLIYFGIMKTPKGPQVLEFNVRFGDPETQAVLSRLESDLAEAMIATIDNRLSNYEFQWSQNPAACVVLASKGYPESYETGFEIKGGR